MSLEFLANELLLDLFEYIHSVRLFRAFHGLNSRIDALLFVHFRRHCLDLRSVSKHDFDFVCRQHLPSMVKQIISLHLSDDDDTPQQSHLFLSRGFNFCQFTYLRSLSLHYIRSDPIVRIIVNECHLIPHLTHLNIIFRCGEDEALLLYIIPRIWSLPKLTHCHLGITWNFYHIFPSLTVISPALECLSIDGVTFDENQLFSLLQHTPRLRRLHVCLENEFDDQELQFAILPLIVLKIIIEDSLQILENFLQNTPNLCHLTVETTGIQPDGHQWKQIITDYLPKLKVFRLKMEFEIFDNTEQTVDEILNSFRSRFWLNEHRWFVQCHWCPKDISTQMCLYTLPYFFPEFVHCPGILSRSTCPDENNHWSYDRVHTLYYSSLYKEYLIPPTFRFSNIHHLYLMLPFNESFTAIVPKLDQLVSLRVCAYDYAESQLQALVNCAPHFSTLAYDSSSLHPQHFIRMNLNVTLRRLDLQGYDHWFDGKECAQLSHSPLGIHCELLRIKVENRTSILDLVKTMTKLRALNVQCLDDLYREQMDELLYVDDSDDVFLMAHDELVGWLRNRLPTVFLVTRDAHQPKDLRLWLR